MIFCDGKFRTDGKRISNTRTHTRASRVQTHNRLFIYRDIFVVHTVHVMCQCIGMKCSVPLSGLNASRALRV